MRQNIEAKFINAEKISSKRKVISIKKIFPSNLNLNEFFFLQLLITIFYISILRKHKKYVEILLFFYQKAGIKRKKAKILLER